MPTYIIERNYVDQLEISPEVAARLRPLNDAAGVRWLYSFLSLDKRRTYCLYEAVSADAIRRAAVLAGLPADVIVEVTGRISPEGVLSPI
ncbi:DUF4242 domain-containing protein [Pengzhenrongella sicca]|uniref:DUF4242 domain-containing protein n=1 Tax=Pengzhenrongella sicca TaxID=2819238 RepID=A0A8A4ZDI0_9MICO|nr:DUF4242 domain-containing protein [Pengzhenrongella sicca]QTE30012.1 DUF4242 domain-containing protein [Pengzhenrongella sicca]